MPKRILCYAVASLLSFSVYGQYTYEAGQDLYHLQTNANNFEGELAYEVSDDGISPAIDLSFNFTFYGTTFTQARMSTNGCLNFGNSGSYCNDYTPDPINGQHTYTIYGFWTDLIRDNDSRMKSWGDNSKMIFGWYDMREYNRASDNSFEIILWNNNSFDIRYGALDIINHDVLIGEVGSSKDNSYTYYYHDECSTGSTNSSTCVNTDWNNTTTNTTLENGGSLFGWGTGSGVDCSDPLNDSSCSGYAQAYLTQQCNITQLHSESCPNYWEAYDDEQCRQDSQYAPFCAGYTQEESVAFFDDSNVDYGFVDEQEQFATGIFEDDYHDDYGFEEQFTVVEIFEDEMFPSYEEFGDDNFEEYFDGSEPEELIIFFEPEPLPFIDDFTPHHDEPLHHQDDILLDEFIFQETFLVEDYSEPETFIEFNSIDELDEWFEEETNENFEERLADLDEPEEEFIEEIFEEEAVEEIFEEIEEMQETMEEELIAEREEEAREEIFEEVIEEFEAIETESPTGKNKLMTVALNVVRAGIQTASNSYSQASGGSQTNNATNNSSNTNLTTGGSTASSGGISTSSSPSASDQFASATQQSNQVLSMSNDMGGSSNATMSITPLPTFDNSASMVVADVQVQNVQGEIDTASSGVMTASEADQIAEKIIAQNIEAQQEEIEEQQQETGKYGDESKLIALIGYVPAFNNYSQVSVPDATDWYISANIYTSATLDDNTGAFYGLVNENLKGLNEMISDEPNIWR